MGWRDLLIGIGFLLLFEGLPLFTAPGAYRRVARQIDAIPEAVLRGAGFLASAIGLVVLYTVFLGGVD